MMMGHPITMTEHLITMMVTLSMMTKEKNAIRFRHEWKHMINRMDDQVVSSRLRKLFPHDAHADSHGIYRVSSLYFDTPYDKALRQKMDGVNQREKFRIRYYNSDLSFIRLEKKMKVNGLCAKRSARLTKTQVEQILRGDLNFLLKSDEPLLVELYSKMQGQQLRPTTIVCYDREAFLYEPGNVRITMDRNLRTGLKSTDFLNT
ncbi:MAG: polyphosphate polymerase domain-containing protein, partial [Lachnospiraceae bacterium]|nr:polyphosphate polymerase domain-containing protein [Lachnospiraceae bacterium]